MKTKHKTINIDGINIFYREAGEKHLPTILLLHGFPSSSHMYRELIELLANHYHLIAPDYPGFGLSDTPSKDDYQYSFDTVTQTIEGFINTLQLSSFYVFMQDYGGPIGFRITSKYPERIKGLIIQNANTYLEGLGEWAMKIGSYQKNNDPEGLHQYKNYLMSADGIKEQYLSGTNNPNNIDPISYLTDTAFITREGNNEIQTELFYNYGVNFSKYPEWQDYLQKHQPPTLIVWGENDKFFSKSGGEAYLNDLKNPSIHFFNSGHFMLEEFSKEVSELIIEFTK
ncbi:alpha/beta hydrolase [Aquimarina sp. D1M17]|uniref:alpha/beta fold hydrolase n=1 Tax=Aquimarina acroporae TaxID=2937283 RepID=UPI0020BE8000|nr:alpha/beta hydrolase [Aquimarina acroporae]MCK8522411.1 alpha/beta hydrolase [Aquimarina acroporae]